MKLFKPLAPRALDDILRQLNPGVSGLVFEHDLVTGMNAPDTVLRLRLDYYDVVEDKYIFYDYEQLSEQYGTTTPLERYRTGGFAAQFIFAFVFESTPSMDEVLAVPVDPQIIDPSAQTQFIGLSQSIDGLGLANAASPYGGRGFVKSQILVQELILPAWKSSSGRSAGDPFALPEQTIIISRSGTTIDVPAARLERDAHGDLHWFALPDSPILEFADAIPIFAPLAGLPLSRG